MKTNRKIFVFACLSALLILGCGKQHTAKQLVSDFIEQNTTVVPSISEVGPLDSALYVTDEAIVRMRQSARKNGIFKPGIRYGERPQNTSTLMMLSVTYTLEGSQHAPKEYRQTFYLDPNLTRVVAVKSDNR